MRDHQMLTTRSDPTRPWPMLAVAVAAALAACSSDDRAASLAQLEGGPTLSTLAASGPADGVDDTSSADTGGPDDAGGGDLLGPGQPCEADAQCEVGWCLATADGYRCPATCVTQACPPGVECKSLTSEGGALARVCVERLVTLCQPCTLHADCNLAPGGADDNRCVSYGEAGRFCGVACGEGLPVCPDGYRCGGDGQCRLRAGACRDCTPLSIAEGAYTDCANSNAFGTCNGRRYCGAMGLTSCDAVVPVAEVCNGADDDCDGVTDEGDFSEACGGYACGPQGCLTSCASDEDCAPGLACDLDDLDEDGRDDECVATGADGSRCADGADCDSGYCANGFCCPGPDGLCCASDADCAALTEAPVCSTTSVVGCSGLQIVGVCNANVCYGEQVDTPEGCVDTLCEPGACLGAVFSPPHRCDELGACTQAGPNIECDDGDPCTFDSCSGEQGCLTTPRDGVTDVACYSGPAETRGVGACQDGLLSCTPGQAPGCKGERLPADEVCDGLDDDCDGDTDEGADAGCWPYRCDGAAGCADRCEDVEDCAAGTFCTNAGVCDPAGNPGSPCDGDDQCATDHCDSGVCCEAGACCDDDGDCDALDALDCSVRTPEGCAGTRTEGVCDLSTFTCGGVTEPDAAACEGQVCDPATCLGTVSRPASLCAADGACAESGAQTECAPYGCEGGACRQSCTEDAHCAPGAVCTSEGTCFGQAPDGAPCGSGAQCASGHCDNGYCCDSGVCCADVTDCAVFDEPPVCEDVESCSGTRVTGVCAESFQCQAATVSAPEACQGQLCGDVSCTNISGLDLIKEGVTRELCDAAGACVASTHDCRDLGSGAYCTDKSGFYRWCEGCSPDRTTCVSILVPCFCE
ncbi:MAG: hypothetical protein CSA66_01875 [Proteobacteria bacterium]|nr:MAG: hypothetical protein CSA66_01875 [Pseudomonadota bacterium]